MALRIETPCVNCHACIGVCPSEAIEAATPHFIIDAKRCTECEGDYADAQCASICPVEEAIIAADGTPLNPLGSLTGIPPERLRRYAEKYNTAV